MGDNGKLGWELLGFGLIFGGPVLGAVVVANKSPTTWAQAWAGAANLAQLLFGTRRSL